MNWKGLFTGIVMAALAANLTGCRTLPPPDQVRCQADEIRAGDTVIISLLDVPEPMLEREYQVRTDGTLNMPLVGSIKAAGQQYGQLEAELKEKYIRGGFYSRATVVIKPGQRFYSVGGEVKLPGRQLYLGETTVLRAIVTCGDFNEFANRKKVEVVRATGERRIVDCNKARRDHRYDVRICPGDHINVPRSL